MLRVAPAEGALIASECFSTRYPVLGGAYVLAGRAAAEIKRRLGESQVPRELARRVVIAAYEAEMNICIHATSGEITLRVEGDEVWVLAEDRGPGIPDLEQALAPGFSTAPPKARELGFGAGMGFPNMRRCADALEVHSEVGRGTTVEMSFHPREERD